MTTYDPHIHGDSSDIDELKRLLTGLDNESRTEPRLFTSTMERLIEMLTEHTDYGENVVRCTFCGAARLPVAMTEGGTTPEYACPICFAQGLIAEGEANS